MSVFPPVQWTCPFKLNNIVTSPCVRLNLHSYNHSMSLQWTYQLNDHHDIVTSPCVPHNYNHVCVVPDESLSPAKSPKLHLCLRGTCKDFPRCGARPYKTRGLLFMLSGLTFLCMCGLGLCPFSGLYYDLLLRSRRGLRLKAHRQKSI